MDQQGSLWTLQFTGETKDQRKEDARPWLQRRSGAGAHSWLWGGEGGQGGTPAVGLSRALPGSGSWLHPSSWQQRLLEPSWFSVFTVMVKDPESHSLDFAHPL